MRKYNFIGPVFAKPAKRRKHPRAVMFTVGSIEFKNEDGVIELGVLDESGFFRAKASFLPSVDKKAREDFLFAVI